MNIKHYEFHARPHPVSVLASGCLLSSVVFFSHAPSYQIAITVCSLIAFVHFNHNATTMRMLLLTAARIVLYILVLYALLSQVPGSHELMHWPWGCYISTRTLFVALGAAARVNTLLFIAGACAGIVKPEDLARGLRQIGVPYWLCFLVVLTFQVFDRLRYNWGLIYEGMRSRGLRFTANIFSKMGRQALIYSMTAFLLLALRQVSEISISSNFRGVDAGMNRRTDLVEYHWGGIDWTIVAAATCCVCGLFWVAHI